MKKHFLLFIHIFLCGMLWFGCGDSSNDQAAAAAEKEAVLLDSIAQELDQTADSLKNEAESVSNTVDQLLDDPGTEQ